METDTNLSESTDTSEHMEMEVELADISLFSILCTQNQNLRQENERLKKENKELINTESITYGYYRRKKNENFILKKKNKKLEEENAILHKKIYVLMMQKNCFFGNKYI